jgi:hypothetical protein
MTGQAVLTVSVRERWVSALRIVGILVAVLGLLSVAWNLGGRRGLPEASPRRFSGAMGGGLFVAVGVFLIALGH